ncbi:hypothetical protein LB524_24340 [Mesorhizobium sp. ESP6-5]|uniref:hypothetical protein n=1 Tax=Mesorhizobium sp. ESP6-5 TaxID=2876623 RepID=UPI001CCE8FDB|nr:hypothetical protein [Mesorhizobium sp. ESP6-5]MBZ9758422.1 hypothetical protein [Mesorhizobium sp. ESP6-5]
MADTGEGKSFGLLFEAWAPAVFGVLSLIALLYFGKPIADKFATHQWTSTGLYSAIFGWAAIQTGFAFGVYGFVIGKSGGFIGALRGTRTMERFERYIGRANWTGFILTFFTIPLIIVEPNLCDARSVSYVSVAIWFSFFVWAFLAFLRLAYNFGALSSVKDKEFHGA